MDLHAAPADQPQDKFQLRAGDSELSLRQILGISLFKNLPSRARSRLQGRSGQGAVVLRQFRAGEIIFRQGEPGWTAYYLLKTDDLLWLRESQYAAAEAAEKLLSKSSPQSLSLSMEERLQRADAMDERREQDASTAWLLRASAWRPSTEELTALRKERKFLSMADALERDLEQAHPTLLAMTPVAKRQYAAALPPEQAALGTQLRVLADCTERRQRVQVSIEYRKPVATRPPGPLARLLDRLASSSPDLSRTQDGGFHTSAPQVDTPVEERPLATLYEGELFGEMACMRRTPRSATVRALRDCYALEFLGNVLDILLTSESFRADLDAVYRQRVLSQHLRGIPLFASAPSEAIELLRRRAELITRRPGEALFEEGDPSDSLYIVRIGTVKLFRRSSGRVIGYRSRGESIGELGLLSGQPRDATCIAYEYPRNAPRVSGREPPVQHCELVRIDRALFEEVCSGFPSFRQELARLAEHDQDERTRIGITQTQTTSRMGELGLLQGRKLMLIDLVRCTFCGDCVSACADSSHDGLPRLSLEGPRFGKYLIPTTCRACTDPLCLIGCPVSAIHQGRAGQIVIEDWCIGCGLCAVQCPYGAIDLRGRSGAAHQRAEVCDQCAGQPSGPQCVAACRHEAASRVAARRLFSDTFRASS